MKKWLCVLAVWLPMFGVAQTHKVLVVYSSPYGECPPAEYAVFCIPHQQGDLYTNFKWFASEKDALAFLTEAQPTIIDAFVVGGAERKVRIKQNVTQVPQPPVVTTQREYIVEGPQ